MDKKGNDMLVYTVRIPRGMRTKLYKKHLYCLHIYLSCREPDIYVTITEEDIKNNVDSILEKSLEVLSE